MKSSTITCLVNYVHVLIRFMYMLIVNTLTVMQSIFKIDADHVHIMSIYVYMKFKIHTHSVVVLITIYY